MVIEFSENNVIGGSLDNFMTVRHILARGSNYEIGKTLGKIAIERHGVEVKNQSDPLTVRSQRLYIRKNYPIHFERMRGVADVYKAELEDDNANLATLPYNFGTAACSDVFYPPESSENGHGILSRNFDFYTGTLSEMLGAPPRRDDKPAMSEPYLVEVYPDEGYPSLYLTSFDLFGCLDGINSKGLAVAVNGDDETAMSHPIEPTMGQAVGFNELQILRFLLDTCGNVEEAKQALLTSKQYYALSPMHYIIADAEGRSFIWEFSPLRNRNYITEGMRGKPQAITNHLIYDAYAPPQGSPVSSNSRERLKALERVISSHPPNQKYSLDFIRETNACVFQEKGDALSRDLRAQPLSRTLWHGIYDTTEKTLAISFYLRDERDEQDRNRAARSEYFKFRLDV